MGCWACLLHEGVSGVDEMAQGIPDQLVLVAHAAQDPAVDSGVATRRRCCLAPSDLTKQ